MATRSFKSISPQELEAAIASAVASITGTDVKAAISGWRELGLDMSLFSGTDKFELQLSLTVGQSYGESRAPSGAQRATGAGGFSPKSGDDDFELDEDGQIKF
ncbi:hypothetical protein [Pseudoduganella lutea]|uniref:Uncharacterized protein n=1 Tax=Pseudoduganella lutea TaxID=321985 RepID=A0A4P6KYJ1_9BURK|nr:hypothetical protein [Pseudoduganella lutea]QBE64271.1 hypothetical protein EWM63_15810 [Pseudoduganella lutea]